MLKMKFLIIFISVFVCMCLLMHVCVYFLFYFFFCNFVVILIRKKNKKFSANYSDVNYFNSMWEMCLYTIVHPHWRRVVAAATVDCPTNYQDFLQYHSVALYPLDFGDRQTYVYRLLDQFFHNTHERGKIIKCNEKREKKIHN